MHRTSDIVHKQRKYNLKKSFIDLVLGIWKGKNKLMLSVEQCVINIELARWWCLILWMHAVFVIMFEEVFASLKFFFWGIALMGINYGFEILKLSSPETEASFVLNLKNLEINSFLKLRIQCLTLSYNPKKV